MTAPEALIARRAVFLAGFSSFQRGSIEAFHQGVATLK
jgi:hypothetical protein